MSEEIKKMLEESNKTLTELQGAIAKVGSDAKSYSEKFEKADADTKAKLAKIELDLKTQDDKIQKDFLGSEAIKNLERSKEETRKELETLLVDKTLSKEKADELINRLKDVENNLANKTEKGDKSMKETPEFKSFMAYASKDKGGLSVDELKYLRTDDGANGGFLIPAPLAAQIEEEVEELDPIRPLCRVFKSKSKSLGVPILTALPEAGYEGEAEEADSDNSEYRLETLTAYRMSVNTPVTYDIINFAPYDMLANATKDAARAFAIKEANKFLLGTGVKQPEGILTNADVISGASTSAVAATVSLVDVIKLAGNLKTGYLANARYAFNQKTLYDLRAEQDNNGNFLWRIGGEGVPNNIAGIPYVVMPSMANISSGSYSVLIGDFFYGYYIMDAVDMAMVRDEYSQKKKAIVELCWHRWNTGQVGIAEAFELLITHA